MRDKKYIIFSVIILFSLLILSWDNIRSLFTPQLKQGEELVLTKGGYIGGIDIATGFYDVEALDSDVEFNLSDMNKGEQLLGIPITKNLQCGVGGKGKVKLTKAKFEKLSLIDNQYQIIHSGDYKVNKCIEPGKYQLSINSDSKEKLKNCMVEILSGKKLKSTVQYLFNDNQSYKIELKQGQLLQVNKGVTEEFDKCDIILKKLE